MAIIHFANYTKNDNGFYYMDIYHPYRGGSNENFNDFSRRILDLKSGKGIGIDFFVTQLLEKKIWDDEYVMSIVPPSDPNKFPAHGTKLLVDSFFKTCNIKKITNGTDFLVRHTKVAKSVGGNRSIDKHNNSIQMKECNLVDGRTILLIDDVTTTGNSLLACKQILENSGCKKVICLALAQTA